MADDQQPTPCLRCEGRGWVGAATATQFAAIGRLALAGKLPTKDCYACAGTGRQEPATHG